MELVIHPGHKVSRTMFCQDSSNQSRIKKGRYHYEDTTLGMEFWVLPKIAWGKKDAIGIDPESGRVEIQPAIMEIDRNLETYLVSKAVSSFF